MRIFTILTASAVLLCTSAPSADAKLPANCIERVESKSGQLLQKVTSEIGRKHSRLENHYNGIQGAFREFTRYFGGAWVKECLAVDPGYTDRFNAWLAKNAQPVSNAAGAKLAEVCGAYTDDLIAKNKAKLDAYMARGATGEATNWVRSFKGHLGRPIVAQCKSRKAEVAEITERYLPGMRNQAQLAGKSAGFSNRAFNVDKMLTRANAAFKSLGSKIMEAPGALDGAQGRADFRTSVATCVEDAAKLRDLGAADDLELTNSQMSGRRPSSGRKAPTPVGRASMTLKEAESMCSEANDGIDELFAKVEAHNKKYRAAKSAAWEKQNIKGSGMRSVYTQNGKRWPRIENLGSQIVWTYRSYTTGALTHECKEYVFSKGGTLKNRKARLCS